MSEREFNDGMNAIIEGLPITLVLNRLGLLLWAVLDAGGPPASRAFRAAVRKYAAHELDEDDDETPDTDDGEECANCGGTGYSSHECGEDTCCCLHPEDNVVCDWCGGKG